jgi:hypothetical protein
VVFLYSDYQFGDEIMWYGKDTEELKKLNEEHRALFGGYPLGYMELKYGECVRDIREAIRQRKELPEVADGAEEPD